MEIAISVLLSLVSFIGMSIVYFLKMAFVKMDQISNDVAALKIDTEILKNK